MDRLKGGASKPMLTLSSSLFPIWSGGSRKWEEQKLLERFVVTDAAALMEANVSVMPCD